MKKQIELKANSIKLGSLDYLGDYLQSLGIAPADVFSFELQPRNSDIDDPAKLRNRDRAATAAYEILSRSTLDNPIHIYVQPDPDTDGFTSSAILIQYLKQRFPSVMVRWNLHEGKNHGIDPSFVKGEEKLVFIPDAGSNDYKQQEELVKAGHMVVILDHHEVENYQDTGAILVNNQDSPDFSNKYLSGAGITYRFIKYRDQKYFAAEKPIADDYLDLAATGIIADARNRTSLGNNYIAYYGLSHIRNQFLKEIINKQSSSPSRGIKDPSHVTKIDVAFYIAPIINGVIRSGTPDDKEIVFKAISTAMDDGPDGGQGWFESEYRGVKRQETLWQYAARLAFNAKNRQDAAKKRGFEQITALIDANGWDKHNLIIAAVDDKVADKINPNFTGLIAMELVKKYNKPCLLLRPTEYEGQLVYGGSGRNGSFSRLPSLLEFLLGSHLVSYAAGHANAFGVFRPLDNIEKLRRYSDEHLQASIFDNDTIAVDYWFKPQSGATTLDTNRLHVFAAASGLYGNSIPQPEFAFTFPYTSNDYQVRGKSQDSVKIHYEGVDFVDFKNAALIEDLDKCSGGIITLVGRPQLNVWQGRESIQVRIDYIEVAPTPAIATATAATTATAANKDDGGAAADNNHQSTTAPLSPLSWSDLL